MAFNRIKRIAAKLCLMRPNRFKGLRREYKTGGAGARTAGETMIWVAAYLLIGVVISAYSYATTEHPEGWPLGFSVMRCCGRSRSFLGSGFGSTDRGDQRSSRITTSLRLNCSLISCASATCSSAIRWSRANVKSTNLASVLPSKETRHRNRRSCGLVFFALAMQHTIGAVGPDGTLYNAAPLT